jgi:gamma-glutamylcyclotransferase (GGCT)/AIG2-like uncharacterized protein YtfP
MLLAVYGTLMTSLNGPDELGIAGRVTSVGPCRLNGTLYDLGAYPGFVPEGDTKVHGELLRLADPSVLDLLDRYEGYDPDRPDASLYVRRTITLADPPGTEAQVYVYNQDPANADPVPSGDWAEHEGIG